MYSCKGKNGFYTFKWLKKIGRVIQVVLVIKNPPANAGDKTFRFDPWVGKILWRRAWQPTPLFLLAESHGQRRLAGYSPWGCKESDMTDGT